MSSIDSFFIISKTDEANDSSTYFEKINELKADNVCIQQMEKRFSTSSFRYPNIDSTNRLFRNVTRNVYYDEDTSKPMLDIEQIAQESWKGRVQNISKEYIDIEVCNDRYNDVKRLLRVSNQAINNNIIPFVGMRATISYSKSRLYSGEIEEKTIIDLISPIDIPLEVKKKSFDEKMKRYSYMFGDEEEH